MSEYIRDIGAKHPEIRDIGKKLPLVDPEVVAQTLDAEPAQFAEAKHPTVLTDRLKTRAMAKADSAGE